MRGWGDKGRAREKLSKRELANAKRVRGREGGREVGRREGIRGGGEEGRKGGQEGKESERG